METEVYIPISDLQHYAFCPRQFALIHVEQAWAENYFTAEGKLLHERVDAGSTEQRGNLRYERGVALISHHHQLVGKMDLLEIETTAANTQRYFPVEYKRGKPKLEDWDRIQLCAQALCLEEMKNTSITEGAIWYWEVRRRESVLLDENLRRTTLAIIAGAQSLLMNNKTPLPAVKKSRCRACSLIDICQPYVLRCDRSAKYVSDLLMLNESEPGLL